LLAGAIAGDVAFFFAATGCLAAAGGFIAAA
jgi:hypothetical protein